MRFPEWLYRLLPGDQGSQQLGVIWRDGAAAGVLTTVGTTVYTVPSDKCLVLTNLTGEFVPGAGETSSRRRFMADPPSGTVRYNILDDHVNIGASAVSDNWQGEVIIPGGWKVRVEGEFAPGAASNAVNCELHGYLIPRGTFVFG